VDIVSLIRVYAVIFISPYNV